MHLIRKPNEGRTIGVVGDVYRFLALGDDTNGNYATWEAIVPPGGGPPPHVHSRSLPLPLHLDPLDLHLERSSFLVA